MFGGDVSRPPSPKKLKRGLQDISPLFQEHSEKTVQTCEASGLAVRGNYCMSVVSMASAEDSLFLNGYLANRLVHEQNECAVISMKEGDETLISEPPVPRELMPHKVVAGQPKRNLPIHYFNMTYGDFVRVSEDAERETLFEREKNRVIFFHLQPDDAPAVEKVVPFLDRWIFHVTPRFESFSRAYKLIKASLSRNPYLDYCILYDGAPEDVRGEYLFEKLYDMTVRRLGISLVWLGALRIGDLARSEETHLYLEHLFLQKQECYNNQEKNILIPSLWSFLHQDKAA